MYEAGAHRVCYVFPLLEAVCVRHHQRMRFAIAMMLLVGGAVRADDSDKRVHDAFMAQLFKEARETKPTTAPVLHVTAEKLTAAYRANELAADKRYKGKRIAITGEVFGVKRTSDGIRVDLNGEGLMVVQCVLPESEADAVADLPENARVTLTCVGDGANTFVVTYPRLKDCAIAK